MTHSFGLFWRAVGAFLALPAVIGFMVPWMLHPSSTPPGAFGIGLLIVGSFLVLWCVRDFYVAGRGTLAPWAPPENLVEVGLYRWSRNPMYIAVLIVLVGWGAAFASPTLWIYALCIAVAFHFRVATHEEPFLLRTHGDAWLSYRTRVRRWI
jgi:protein-S-isoprenylcysteine O-methyltransferase Ste14